MGKGDHELERGAHAITYRITQMTDALDQLILGTTDLPMRNALLESLLINARSLAYFLKQKNHPQDVLASHFLPSWSPLNNVGRIIGLVSDHLAHAKYADPTTPEAPNRKIVRIAEALVGRLNLLHAKLIGADPARAQWFLPSIEYANSVLSRIDPEWGADRVSRPQGVSTLTGTLRS